MSELILCRNGIASMPYYIENASLNIYSLEELSYYLMENLYEVDDALFTEELFTWLEREFNEKKLAEALRECKAKNGTIYQSVMTVLISGGYCSKKELTEADGVLKELQNKSELWCRKLRADRYQADGKYAKSIVEYQNILKHTKETNEERELLGNIWHNLGCAYANLFLYEEAIDCFEKAYAKNENEDSNRLKLLTEQILQKAVVMEDCETDAFTEKMAQISQAKLVKNEQREAELIAQIAQDWKQDYQSMSRV